jgi:RND family efflux transporter MFP subunit
MKVATVVLMLALLLAAFAGGYLARGTGHSAREQANAATPERKILYYVDPMHPAYTSDKPGVAPDCGMELEPVYEGSAGAGSAASTSMPTGAVQISPERRQLIGVKFATAQIEPATRTIRTVGTVAADETRVVHVHPRFEGWIERVHGDFVGQLVRRGQPLVSIYSPEMLASQQELLLARRARELMKENPLPSASGHGESLFEAAKRRLELWGLTRRQIEQVLETGEPVPIVTLSAPARGYITVRNAFPSQKVTPDTELYTIVDLGRVWVFADVYESDIASIRVGQTARVAAAYADGPPLTARVNYIQPQVDPATRTLKVRLEMSNPGTRLKPGMFVNAEFDAGEATRLTVPVDAVVDSGAAQTVFVDRGQGYLEPRRVEVGERLGDRVAIKSGLAAGERVVASGTFLVDSESRLKAAAAGMTEAPGGHSSHGTGAGTAGGARP